MVLALACLVTAVALAPDSPKIIYLPEQGLRQRPEPRGMVSTFAAPGGASVYQPVQNCSGGISVNCHTNQNQAGL